VLEIRKGEEHNRAERGKKELESWPAKLMRSSGKNKRDESDIEKAEAKKKYGNTRSENEIMDRKDKSTQDPLSNTGKMSSKGEKRRAGS